MYNRSEIMKNAWEFYRNSRNGGYAACTYESFSSCLKTAWSIAKQSAREESVKKSIESDLKACVKKIVESKGAYEAELEIRKMMRAAGEKFDAVRILFDKHEVSEEAFDEAHARVATECKVLSEIRSSLRKPNYLWMYDLGPIPEEKF